MERWNVRGHAYDQNDIGVPRHVPEANPGAHTTRWTVHSPRSKHFKLVSESRFVSGVPLGTHGITSLTETLVLNSFRLY